MHYFQMRKGLLGTRAELGADLLAAPLVGEPLGCCCCCCSVPDAALTREAAVPNLGTTPLGAAADIKLLGGRDPVRLPPLLPLFSLSSEVPPTMSAAPEPEWRFTAPAEGREPPQVDTLGAISFGTPRFSCIHLATGQESK